MILYYTDFHDWFDFGYKILSKWRPLDHTLYLKGMRSLDNPRLIATMGLLEEKVILKLDLTGNSLGKRPAKVLHMMLANLPRGTLKVLDLSSNQLGDLTSDALKYMLEGLEATYIYDLTLGDNFSDNMTVDDLANALTGLKNTNVRMIEFGSGDFYKLSCQDLEKLSKSIFQDTKIYKLRTDKFNFSKEQLDALYKYSPAKSFQAFMAGNPAAIDKTLEEVDPNQYPNQGLASLPKNVIHKIGLFTGLQFNPLTNDELDQLQQLGCLGKKP